MYRLLAASENTEIVTTQTVERLRRNESVANNEWYIQEIIRTFDKQKEAHNANMAQLRILIDTATKTKPEFKHKKSIVVIGKILMWKLKISGANTFGMGKIDDLRRNNELNIFGNNKSCQLLQTLAESDDIYIFHNMLYNDFNRIICINEMIVWTNFTVEFGQIIAELLVHVTETDSDDTDDDSAEITIDFQKIPGGIVNNKVNEKKYNLYKNYQVIRNMLAYAKKHSGALLPYVEFLENTYERTEAQQRDFNAVQTWFQEDRKNNHVENEDLEQQCSVMIEDAEGNVHQCTGTIFTICDCYHYDASKNNTHGQCGRHTECDFRCKYHPVLCNETDCTLAVVELCNDESCQFVDTLHGKCLQHRRNSCEYS